MFDWRRFLDQHHVDYVMAGRADVEVACPFCGEGDGHHHMGISLSGKGWGCWRNAEHRGRNPARLIQALIHCTWDEASRIAGNDRPLPAPSQDMAALMAKYVGVDHTPRHRVYGLHLPKEFKPFAAPAPVTFWDYMRERGYDIAATLALAEQYNLRWCLTGPYKYRILFPVCDSGSQLRTWTGRSIQPDARLRYKTLPVLPEDEDSPAALEAPGNLLLGLPLLWTAPNPRALVVCEGPFDALRITQLGHRRGVYGTCLFGKQLSASQGELLAQLAARYPNIHLLLDPDAELTVLGVLRNLAGLPVKWARLPAPFEDPGELSREAGAEFIGTLAA